MIQHRKNPKFNENHLRYFSIHKYDNGEFFPGKVLGTTGEYFDGQIVNVGFNRDRGDKFYHRIFDNTLLPEGRKFKPDIILVSMGFDAAEGDPLGNCHVTPQGYYRMIQKLQNITPKIGLILEGGYNLQAISESSAACLKALLKVPIDTKYGPPNEINLF